MPKIFDNIENHFVQGLHNTLDVSHRGDFCVGYFNLRGWKQVAIQMDNLKGGDGNYCRLLIGMQKPLLEIIREYFYKTEQGIIDNQTAASIKKKLAQEFKDQLTIGIPTEEDEIGLRRLSQQIKDKKVVVKLFLRHPLHAKLYLLFRDDKISPIIGYLGSSNLTLAGLLHQGELNVDVLEQDAASKLTKWFEDRWNDRWCIEISGELAEIIDNSWAADRLVSPYHIYLKIAYHLSREARAGLTEFKIPKILQEKLHSFQLRLFIPEDKDLGICPEKFIESIGGRLKKRIEENAEVVGSDEVFFDGDPVKIHDFYNEKQGILDEEDDTEVDLASYAYQIWKNATDADPTLKKTIPDLPHVIYATKSLKQEDEKKNEGVVVYTRMADDNDVLVWVDRNGEIITQSQHEILKAAECNSDTPALYKLDNHHKLVEKGIEHIRQVESAIGGQLGKKSGARYRTYMRLNRYYEEYKGTLFVNEALKRAIDDIYKFPLKEFARETLNRQLKAGISDEDLANLIVSLRNENKLCNTKEEEKTYKEPQIICSLGLIR